jgi:hypothetical protein
MCLVLLRLSVKFGYYIANDLVALLEALESDGMKYINHLRCALCKDRLIDAEFSQNTNTDQVAATDFTNHTAIVRLDILIKVKS